MNYDVFISYARKDDVDARVSTFVDALSRFHKVITGDELRVFFDRDEIRSGDDWYLRLLESLRHSASMVALLSPAYLESEYCWIEWTTFERQAAVAMAVDQGIKPLVVVPQPGLESALDSVSPTWLVGRTPWRSLLDPLQRGTVDLTTGRNIDDLLNRLTEESIRRRLADLTGSIEIEDTFTGELVESVRWIRRLRLRRDKAKASAAHRMPTLRPGFVGRVPELRAMRRALAEGTEVAVSAEGVGGIGKTEIAIAYAHAFAWDYPGGRWFIPAEGQIKLAPLLANAMADGLGVILTPEQSADSDGGFRYIVSRLRTLPDDARKVLVVLDNVDQDALVSAEAVRSLGVDAEWFDLIITSRKRLRGESSDGTLRMVRIDVLPDRELLTLLGLSPDAPETERTAAASLLERTGRLTLAVEIAGAYCRRNSVSLSDYVADLEDVLEGLSDSLNAGAATEINHSGKYVDRLFRLSIESLSPPAKMILGYACRMHPDHVVIPWLSELCCREDSTLAKRKLGMTGFEAALLELQNASLMEAPDATGRICRMHRLLGDTVRKLQLDYTSAPDYFCLKCSCGEAKNVLGRKPNEVDQSTAKFRVCGKCQSASADRFIFENLTNLLVNWYRVERRWEVIPMVSWVDWFGNETPESNAFIGKLLYLLGNYDNAHRYLSKSVYLYQNQDVPNPHNLIVTLSDVAVLLREMGQHELSLLKSDQALELLATHGGINTPTLAKLKSDRGRTLELLGCADQAEDWYRQALNACESIEEDNYLYRSEILSNLAGLLHDKGSTNQSLELYEQALQLCRNRLDENHPWIAELYNNMALSLYIAGSRSRAIELFELAISIGSSHLDPEHPYHPKLAIAHGNIAQLLWDEGRLDDARDHLNRSIVMDEQCFGKQYAGLRQSYSMLTGLLKELGESNLA